MRIIGGTHRGRALASVGRGDAAAHLRPTTDRVRESLFNLLAHGGYAERPLPEGYRVLDLFAGTGALGLEALSRGAEQAVFVDQGRKAQKILEENISKLGVLPQTKVIPKDATRLGKCVSDPFRLVFLDPPYGKKLGEKALASAAAGGWIAPGSVIVWEESDAVRKPQGFSRLDERRYGDTVISIFRFDGT